VSDGVVVEREDNGDFVVRGRSAQRAVALSDLTNAEALAYAQQRLRRLGVHRALARAGARRGDLVHIGGLAFEYEPDR
jgi:GTP-binding protein